MTYLTLMMTEYAIDWKLNSIVAGCGACAYVGYHCTTFVYRIL